MKIAGIEKLFGLDGYIIDSISFSTELVHVRLHRDRRRKLECPNCNESMGRNDENPRVVLDLPLGEAKYVMIQYNAIQGRCRHCGTYATFHPPGVDAYAKATRRLKEYVSRLCRYLPACHVGEFVGISDETARRWDKEILQETIGQPKLEGLRYVLVDEKSIGRHHKYVTVVLDAETGELLHLTPGKKKESLESFFSLLGKEQRDSILAVGIDRNGAYAEVVRQETNAEIVHDKFHLVKNLGEAIDQVRREEVAKANKDEKKVIKGQRYNLLRHAENLTDKQSGRLDSLLKVNESLHTGYVLKEAFRWLWEYTYPKNAEKYLHKWCAWAVESGLTPLVRFAQGLLRDQRGILAHFRHGITNGPIEAFNSVIGRAIYRACGIKDLDYLFLKLRQESL